MEGDWGGNAVQEAHSKDAAEKPFHNGREMRNLLPLCKENGRAAGRLKNSAETPEHCPLGANRLSLLRGEGLVGGKTMPTLSAIPLFEGICSLRSHIPARLRRALQKMKKKSCSSELDSFFSSSSAERGGFEPPEPTRSSTVFETAPFDHSGIFPDFRAANITAKF